MDSEITTLQVECHMIVHIISLTHPVLVVIKHSKTHLSVPLLSLGSPPACVSLPPSVSLALLSQLRCVSCLSTTATNCLAF